MINGFPGKLLVVDENGRTIFINKSQIVACYLEENESN